MNFDIHHSECVAFMRTLPDNSVDAIVTDPPYGLAFMGKKWDYDVPSEDVWGECLRVLKPGGHLLAFAGTRTQHRMAVRIENAGFEIRDMIAWVYGSGFPKSLDVSKAIDKTAGAEREVVGVAGKSGSDRNSMAGDFAGGEYMNTAPATPEAQQWSGWGTALKPALEPITVARKPFTGTVAANVLEHGTGALNVDGCRVGRDTDDVSGWSQTGSKASENRRLSGGNYARDAKPDASGRWPANLIHDGSEEVVALFPETHSTAAPNSYEKTYKKNTPNVYGKYNNIAFPISGSANDNGGSAARFFYCAKASKRDRDEGCKGMEAKPAGALNMRTEAHAERNEQTTGPRANHHPTVKPTDLMRYLCRLVTPPGGTVLDPFMGSGSTGKAAVLEGFNFIGCDMTAEYVDIARARITHAFNSQPNKLEI